MKKIVFITAIGLIVLMFQPATACEGDDCPQVCPGPGCETIDVSGCLDISADEFLKNNTELVTPDKAVTDYKAGQVINAYGAVEEPLTATAVGHLYQDDDHAVQASTEYGDHAHAIKTVQDLYIKTETGPDCPVLEVEAWNDAITKVHSEILPQEMSSGTDTWLGTHINMLGTENQFSVTNYQRSEFETVSGNRYQKGYTEALIQGANFDPEQ